MPDGSGHRIMTIYSTAQAAVPQDKMMLSNIFSASTVNPCDQKLMSFVLIASISLLFLSLAIYYVLKRSMKDIKNKAYRE